MINVHKGPRDRSQFQRAWARFSEADGEHIYSKNLKMLLTELGFRASAPLRREGRTIFSSASELEAVECLKALGVSSRDIAKGVLIRRHDLESWYLLQPPPGGCGTNGRANPLLTRSVIGAGRSGWHDLPDASHNYGKDMPPPVKSFKEVLEHRTTPYDDSDPRGIVGIAPVLGEDGRIYGHKPVPRERIIDSLRGDNFDIQQSDVTGYLQAPGTREGRRLGRAPAPVDTRANTLRRVAIRGPESAIDYTTGLYHSRYILPQDCLDGSEEQRVRDYAVDTLKRSSMHAKDLPAQTGIKGDYAWKSALFRDVPSRVCTSGMPGSTKYSYSTRS